MGRGCAGYEHAVTHTHGAAITGNRLPDTAGGNTPSSRTTRYRFRLVDGGDGVQMVAQITGCGEERRLAIFIAAIARDRPCLRKSCIEGGVILCVECKAEDIQIVIAVLTFAQTRPDDGGSHRLMFQHPAAGNVRQ